MSSQESLSVYQSLCRRHVKAAFNRNLQEWLAETEVRRELERIQSLANQLMDQQHIAAAATMLSTMVLTILEDDYFHHLTLQLSEFLTECVTDLGACLRSERATAAVRNDILQALLQLATFYVEQESYAAPYGELYMTILSSATAEERHACALWIRAQGLPGGRFAGDYQGFLLDLEADTLSDEEFFQRARAVGAAKRIVQRLLMRGRVEEAIGEAVLLAKHDYEVEEIAGLFRTHGYEAETERLILERLKHGESERLQRWLREYYRHAGKDAQALEVAMQLFTKRPSFPEYLAVRTLAETLGGFEQVEPGLQAALSGSQQAMPLLLEMALDDRHIDLALELLLGEEPRTNTVSSTELYIATAAEDIQPERALEIYQRRVRQLLAFRERKAYREACRFVLKVRHVYERIDAHGQWQEYIAELKTINGGLPAFLEELRNALVEERASW